MADIVIITAPSELMVKEYEYRLQDMKHSYASFAPIEFFCVADPEGHRVGSGGGTLNALDLIVNKCSKYHVLSKRVAIIHSGGDSRRAPFHSVCGKGWASLSCGLSEEQFSSPIVLILNEINKIFELSDFPCLVVASGDVLLDVARASDEFYVQYDAVSVIAVPMDPKIARNHGVLGISSEVYTLDSEVISTPAEKYLQKPSIEIMEKEGLILRKETDSVLVDTGIVIFSGCAFDYMLSFLSDPHVSLSTARLSFAAGDDHDGIVCLSEEPKSSLCPCNSADSLPSVRLELYSEFLLAMKLEEMSISFEDYLKVLKVAVIDEEGNKDHYFKALERIWMDFKEVPLYCIAVLDGSFSHLGTSSEIFDLCIQYSSSSSMDCISNEKLMKVKTEHAFAAINSIVESSVNASVTEEDSENKACFCHIHPRCLVEHSFISGPYYISEECVVSHVDPFWGNHLYLAPKTMIQGVFLRNSALSFNEPDSDFASMSCVSSNDTLVLDTDWESDACLLSDPSMANSFSLDCFEDGMHRRQPSPNNIHYSNSSEFPFEAGDEDHECQCPPICNPWLHCKTLLILSLYDDPKLHLTDKKATYCSRPWSDFFSCFDCSPEDLWSMDSLSGLSNNLDPPSLWNAKLFPIYNQNDSTLLHRGIVGIQALIVYSWGNHLEIVQVPDELRSKIRQLSTNFSELVKHWKNSPRISLSELLLHGDVGLQFDWRRYIETFLSSDAFSSMKSRLSQPCKSVNIRSEDPLSFGNLGRHLYELFITFYRNILIVDSSVIYPLPSSSLSSSPFDLAVVFCQIIWRANLCNSRLLEYGLSGVLDCVLDVISSTLLVVLSNRCFFVNRVQEIWNFAQDLPEEFRLFFLDYLTVLTAWRSPSAVKSSMVALCSLVNDVDPNCHPRLLFNCADLCRYRRAYLTPVDIERAEAVLNDIFVLISTAPSSWNNSEDIKQFFKNIGSTMMKTFLSFLCMSSIKSNRRPSCNSSCENLKKTIERIAQALISAQIQYSIFHYLHYASPASLFFPHKEDCIIDFQQPLDWVTTVCSPARIDIAGGWSDTPPICYDYHGSVVNVSIKVDGNLPIRCSCRRISEPIIRLRNVSLKGFSESKTCYTLEDLEEKIVECRSFNDFLDVRDPYAPCALLKAVLLALEIVNVSSMHEQSPTNNGVTREEAESRFSSHCKLLFAGGGFEIACLSFLPTGSGLGGSSVMAATVLSAICNWKRRFDEIYAPGSPFMLTSLDLVYLVAQVEQILTTGGGWQDQVGCIYGGIKIGRSSPSLPLKLSVEPIFLSLDFYHELNSRMFLIYTGQQRLAKNTLLTALRRYSRCPNTNKDPSIDNIVVELSSLSESTFVMLKDDHLNVESKVTALGSILDSYWSLKRRMAVGSEPFFVSRLFEALRPHCCGLSLCGAGGGGFAVGVLHPNASNDIWNDIRNVLQCVEDSVNKDSRIGSLEIKFSLHAVEIHSNESGMSCEVHDNDSHRNLAEYLLIS